MRSSITVRSPGAIALGALFGLGTAYVLFNDVQGLAGISVDHVMTALVLVGTIASGHLIWPMLRHWRTWGSAAGLALLFVSGTWYMVTGSAGRNAVATAAKVAGVDTANDERKRADRDLVEAKRRYAAALEAETGECASGAGARCKARRETTAERRADVEKAEATLRNAPPERIANGGTKYAADVLAIFVPADPERIERALDLTGPFVKAMFLEIATLVFLGIGLGHGRRMLPTRPATVATPAPPKPRARQPRKVLGTRVASAAIATVAAPTATVVAFPGRGQPLQPASKAEALLIVQAEIARQGSIPSQDAIAVRCRVHKATVSRWLASWERAGFLSRAQDGRCKVVATA